jgi:N-acetylmuramoyl-L-alanine amidase
VLPLTLHPATPKLRPYELKCLVDNVYYEARGESIKGQLLVAKVTLNRAKPYGSICAAVYEPFQFSWTLKKQPKPNPEVYLKVAEVAQKALYFSLPVNYFHNDTVKPVWSYNKTIVVKEGKHTFYR